MRLLKETSAPLAKRGITLLFVIPAQCRFVAKEPTDQYSQSKPPSISDSINQLVITPDDISPLPQCFDEAGFAGGIDVERRHEREMFNLLADISISQILG